MPGSLVFCLGREDNTEFPPGFKNTMNKRARDTFEWSKHMKEDDIQMNIIHALSFLDDCLMERKLVQYCVCVCVFVHACTCI